ncbi:cell surface protein SprA [Odoribacter sp. OF09-27XD]|nr:cell surface protein SprA [Odoribacter sp. OF09-27XD]
MNIVPALSVAYYPEERGPYNFEVEPTRYSRGTDKNGKLKDPETRWGGMMRAVYTNDFEAANVQYIEMWLMDPFVYNADHKGGEVYIDLGNVSEDILRDGRKSFENGLPTSANVINVDSTKWGRVPTVQSIVNGFDNNTQARRFQDVGLDGLSDEDERSYFSGYLERIRQQFGENSEMYRQAYDDPSGDNYHFSGGRISMPVKLLFWNVTKDTTIPRETRLRQICRRSPILRQRQTCRMWRTLTAIIR